MEKNVFVDALSGSAVAFDYMTGEAYLAEDEAAAPASCTSLFFPGCSLINYAMPLASSAYETLSEAGRVDGISLLCCGRILSYEPDGDKIRASFENQLCDRLAQMDIVRIVTACPNCFKALNNALSEDERTARIEIVALPRVLAELGCRIDRDGAALLMKGDATAPLLLCTHDSCPDRKVGEFARGLRAMMPEGLCVDPEHCFVHSLCCGSLARAAGKIEAADDFARRNGQEALDVGADAIVTACMSCVFQLSMAQSAVPAVHFLELLYSRRVDWANVGAWMKLRFLFDETLGVIKPSEGNRAFKGLGASS